MNPDYNILDTWKCFVHDNALLKFGRVVIMYNALDNTVHWGKINAPFNHYYADLSKTPCVSLCKKLSSTGGAIPADEELWREYQNEDSQLEPCLECLIVAERLSV